jgi:cytidylate kinase
MATITISRGSYSRGKEIAEKVAQKLGYECVSRDVILEAHEEFGVPEIKLVQAIKNDPSILERFTSGKRRYVAYVEASLLRHVARRPVVYHGLAGHFLLRNLPHVLKVRVLADMEDRVSAQMERDGSSREEALRLLKHDDEERRKWSQALYGIDTADASLYDIVLHIGKLGVDDAVEIICRTSKLPQFQTAPEAQAKTEDLALAAEARAGLLHLDPDIEVRAEKGVLHVHTKALVAHEHRAVARIEAAALALEGVRSVKVHTTPLDAY